MYIIVTIIWTFQERPHHISIGKTTRVKVLYKAIYLRKKKQSFSTHRLTPLGFTIDHVILNVPGKTLSYTLLKFHICKIEISGLLKISFKQRPSLRKLLNHARSLGMIGYDHLTLHIIDHVCWLSSFVRIL